MSYVYMYVFDVFVMYARAVRACRRAVSANMRGRVGYVRPIRICSVSKLAIMDHEFEFDPVPVIVGTPLLFCPNPLFALSSLNRSVSRIHGCVESWGTG